jgi:tetratricopeptide (TPR) repeat protein
MTDPTAPRARGMFADPMVRAMALVAAAIVIGFLMFTIIVLFEGYLDPAAPRTFVEAKLTENEAYVEAGATEPTVWRDYVTLLIESKQYAKAQSVIDEAEGVINDEWGQDRLLMQVELLIAQGRYDEAIAIADEAQAKIEETYERELASTELPNRAKAYGISENHSLLSLMKAEIYLEQEKWAEAQAQMQLYADANPTEAGILIDLGDVKVKNGDLEGARADFERALMFLPEDPEILKRLDEIGAE